MRAPRRWRPAQNGIMRPRGRRRAPPPKTTSRRRRMSKQRCCQDMSLAGQLLGYALYVLLHCVAPWVASTSVALIGRGVVWVCASCDLYCTILSSYRDSAFQHTCLVIRRVQIYLTLEKPQSQCIADQLKYHHEYQDMTIVGLSQLLPLSVCYAC